MMMIIVLSFTLKYFFQNFLIMQIAMRNSWYLFTRHIETIKASLELGTLCVAVVANYTITTAATSDEEILLDHVLTSNHQNGHLCLTPTALRGRIYFIAPFFLLLEDTIFTLLCISFRCWISFMKHVFYTYLLFQFSILRNTISTMLWVWYFLGGSWNDSHTETVVILPHWTVLWLLLSLTLLVSLLLLLLWLYVGGLCLKYSVKCYESMFTYTYIFTYMKYAYMIIRCMDYEAVLFSFAMTDSFIVIAESLLVLLFVTSTLSIE